MVSVQLGLLAVVLFQLIGFQHCGAFVHRNIGYPSSHRKMLSSRWLQKSPNKPQQRALLSLFSVFNQVEEEEERDAFYKLAENYLAAKFHDCLKEECIFLREEGDVKELLRSILPPVTASELEKEVDRIVALFGGKRATTPDSPPCEISISEFVQAVLANPYWTSAGPLVVKELIYLDCLYNFYHRKKQLLSNEDYNELKDQLAWDGSIAATMKGKEALFITAVAAHRRGAPLLSNGEYMNLKNELLAENSWVVNRQQDPLERMGLQTFMSYLHRSL
mmetsp:Transcript_9028/g.9774  ORF Transcript_9028/g.9774 Transcript_9028/m.9774 type:complete len:277 (-) Transcript_9028:26-856(-)